MNRPYTARIIVSSITLILCGLCNYILHLLRQFFGIINTVTDITQSNLDYTKIDTWTDILGTLSSIRILYNHSLNALAIFQFISGISGIVFAVLFNSKKYSEKVKRFKSFPFILGIITCIIGGISYLTLLFSKNSSVFFCVITFITYLITPIIFTISSNQFRKGDTI